MHTSGYLLSLLLMVCEPSAMAHGGGLNAEGCHTNRKTGDYHCHRTPASSRPASSPATGQSAHPGHSAASGPTTVPTTAQKCYVGPRGGTYTITASGRKNYKGC